MKTIQLTQGKFALVDDEDFEALNAHKWRGQKSGQTWYAVRTEPGTRRAILMHVVIHGTGVGFETDHENGDGLDNRRANLRTTTKHQNQHNRTRKAKGASKFRGVSWSRSHGKWQASIRCNWKSTWLGRFSTEHAAAQAYDDAGFARDPEHFTPNFPRITIEIDRS